MSNENLKNFLKKIKLNESLISIILGAVVVVVVAILIFNYFKGVDRTEKATTDISTEEVQLVEEEGKIIPLGLPTIYTVEEGDHLWSIAEKFYTSGYNWVDIARENNLVNPNVLLVGQELNIPKAEVIMLETEVAEPSITGNSYTIEENDNLWDIAVRAYGDGYQWVKIASENNLANPDLIYSGNTLAIPR